MKNSNVRAAAMRRMRRTPGEERSVELGIVLGCGGILQRERTWRKHEMRGSTEARLAPGLQTPEENTRRLEGRDPGARRSKFSSAVKLKRLCSPLEREPWQTDNR